MANIAAPEASASTTIIVPMTLQAFIVADDFGDTPYQVAPLIQPDYSKLQQHEPTGQESVGASWDHHDLMDHLDISWSRLQARYNTRFRDLTTGRPREGRSGVYLSWCLPRMFRAAITATESATSTVEGQNHLEERKLRGGFSLQKSEDDSKPSEDDVQFRAAPDCWIVIRKVRSLRSKVQPDEQVRDTWTLVESNCMRSLDDNELMRPDGPDIEGITSPSIDRIKDDQDIPAVLGRWADLTSDNLAGFEKRVYRRPFNAFEMGHEFFVDYQPHNMGVFSFFDDLGDCVGTDPYDQATVDYAVIGFFSKASDDPLMLEESSFSSRKQPLTNQELMDGLGLVLDNNRDQQDAGKAKADSFLAATANEHGRTLTHGVLRNLRFGRKNSSHLSVPSIRFQEDIYEHQPIAVGLHTLDALAAFLYVSLGGPKNSSAAVHTLLSQLVMLVARDDDVDSQRKAADEVSGYSWIPNEENKIWQLPDQGEEEKRPDPNTIKMFRGPLSKLNHLQRRRDTCIREEKQLVQQLYGCWWNAVGLRKLSADIVLVSRRAQVREQATAIGKKIAVLMECKKQLDLKINAAIEVVETSLGPGKKLISAPARPFGRHQDPTILLAGAKSGWPPSFSRPLEVRLAEEVAPSTSSPTPTELWLDGLLPNLAESLKPLWRELSLSDGDWRKSPYSGLQDVKDVQGWFPLFIEWELEYYHVPFSRWAFEPSDEMSGRWRWVIPSQVNISDDPAIGQDCRRIHGRTAFAPEAALTLRSRLGQLFSQSTDPAVKALKDDVLARVSAIEYFSAPLSGLTDHLLTLRRGHHPRPTTSSASRDPSMLELLGLEPDLVKLIEGNAPDLAPFGASPTAVLPPSYLVSGQNPFKPVTHGQARFTKLVVVDKFGQIVSGIRPEEYASNGDGDEWSALYPCVSPGFACGAIPADDLSPGYYWPNTAIRADSSPNVCQFFQIPPRINQDSRLNAAFLMPINGDASTSADTENSSRHPVTEWQNPIWAWLVTNFQNHSIQVYDGDGRFVQEVCILSGDGPLPTNARVKFSMGPNSGGFVAPAKGRLHDILDAMLRPDFTYALFDMLAGAADSGWRATSAHLDDMLPAAIGRPFCIADVSISIELATSPLSNTSLLSSAVSQPEASILDYEFPVALGNHTAAFDGLVGTFAAQGSVDSIATAYSRDASQQESLTNDSFKMTKNGPQPLLVKPYFNEEYSFNDDNFINTHNAQLARSCVSLIMDPKLPLHIYSGSLFPMVELSLPRWPVDAAMSKMQAFFALGPILVPEKPRGDVFRATTTTSDDLMMAAEPAVQMLAAGSSDVWRWMQPKWQGSDSSETHGGNDSDELTTWFPVRIRPVDEVLKVEAAAQSELVEGYIMLRSSDSDSKVIG